MFEFQDLPLASVDEGTNLLVVGPNTASVRELFLRMIAPVPGEEAVILVATNSDGSALVAECETVGRLLDRRTVGVVDAAGTTDRPDVGQFRTVSSPADLAGIGHSVSEIHEAFASEGAHRIRVGVESISMVLMYLEVQTVFRFLHIMTTRVASADGLGVYGIDPSSHSEQTLKTLSQLFDGRIEVRMDAGESELRVRGVADHPREWQPF